MRFFAEIEPPETVYIHEAALWIAFGRVPEVNSSPEWEDPFDVRGDADHELGFLEAATKTSYDKLPEEIPEILTGIDLPKFQEALRSTLGLQVKDIEIERLNYKEMLDAADGSGAAQKFPEGRVQFLRDNLDRCDREIVMARAIQPTYETIFSYEERARAKLFYFLSSGELDAVGWHRCAQEDENCETARWEERGVEINHWRMGEIDWQRANLGKDENQSPNWVAVRVDFKALLTLFPQPDLQSEELTVSRCGGILMHSGDLISQSSGSVRKKGRPPKGDGHVKTAVLNHFLKRHAALDLPAKREAIIEEASEWVEDIFEMKLSRTSLQRHLKPLFSMMTN